MKKYIIVYLIICTMLTACTSDDSVKEIMKAAKIKQNIAVKILETLKQIGYQEITSIKCNHHNTEHFVCFVKNFNYFGDGGLMIFLYPNGTVKNITNYHNVLYKDNEVIANYFDYSITVDDFIYLVRNSEEKTKLILKAPSTAIFPKWQEWKANFSKDKIILSAYVDSQNSFGAMIRTQIQFVYGRQQKYKGFEYFFKSANIGNVSIK